MEEFRIARRCSALANVCSYLDTSSSFSAVVKEVTNCNSALISSIDLSSGNRGGAAGRRTDLLTDVELVVAEFGCCVGLDCVEGGGGGGVKFCAEANDLTARLKG
eukprot:CAMPEP_0118655214 /NCGR_PEP_ID=MMETSP0785-20121206/12804_1 /TAXON_ID=91992 /ORGANISM="Bolidomonas pacifica, Strain CCMP 1866" /LENGTH=104 /DNA_ID=CAMNT_0006547927 /DNA_START=366 /DNA_END=676 /DNA_ORIENTATION=+